MAEHFHALRVAEIVPETDDANSIRFDVPHALKNAFIFKAGQHLTLRADIAGEEVRRNYSLCVAPHEGQVRPTFKLAPHEEQKSEPATLAAPQVPQRPGNGGT